MRFKKIIHSTFLLEKNDSCILFDPGNFSENFGIFDRVDAIVISHKHQDHFSLEHLSSIISRNPRVKIFTSSDIANEITASGLKVNVETLENETRDVCGFTIESLKTNHIKAWHENIDMGIHHSFVIDGSFYNSVDSFDTPPADFKAIAYMIAGPLTNTSDSLDFITNSRPRLALGMHDGQLNRVTLNHNAPKSHLPKYGIAFNCEKELWIDLSIL